MRTNEEDLHKTPIAKKEREFQEGQTGRTQQNRNDNAYTEYRTRRTNSWIIKDNKNNGINGDSR
jgi:hypothetical protein